MSTGTFITNVKRFILGAAVTTSLLLGGVATSAQAASSLPVDIAGEPAPAPYLCSSLQNWLDYHSTSTHGWRRVSLRLMNGECS